MPGTLTFHDATDADRPAYNRLFRAYAALYGRDLTDDHLDWAWDSFTTGPNRCLIADLDGRTVGFVQYRLYRWLLHGTTSVFADDMYVDPDARGNGIGRRLLEELARLCHRNGWEGVRWFATSGNEDGQRLYDRFGGRAHVVTYDLFPIAD
ncbi:GNAT family N-acetyltransferase [Nigerium massiliense]|uniref:GNAT family N-acetyltransferase n=1 Tax=Nigerium massiliense TaxID=1522317 RepID=UPI0006944B57|nr:GNAT family N-acetyltransferase [Nigerium massiliense]